MLSHKLHGNHKKLEMEDSDSEEEEKMSAAQSSCVDEQLPRQKNIYDDDSEDEFIMKPKSSNVEKTNDSVSIEKEEKEREKKKMMLKSPICAVMGHVNAGKTSFLNYVRGAGMKYKEVNNITQSLDATTHISKTDIKNKIKNINFKKKINVKINGILFIDTPGHELFMTLRERSTLLCDLALIIIDINHGLELQTIESLELLKKTKKPFIVLLNKVDTLSDWNLIESNGKFSDKKICTKQNKCKKNLSFLKVLKKQNKHTIKDFNRKLNNIKLQFNKKGYNCSLWYNNKNETSDVSLVPISANTGVGFSDLLYVITNLTQKYMKKSKKKFKCNILEVKNINGYGFVLDSILSNGILKQGDRMLCNDINGNIVDTNVKILLVLNNGKYQHVKEVEGSNAIRIVAKELKNVMAGTKIKLISKNKNKEAIDKIKLEMKILFNNRLRQISNNNNNMSKHSNKGVFIHSSQFGSLEVLKNYLIKLNIPIYGMRIGNLKREDITKISHMAENITNNQKYACIFSYNCNNNKISKDLLLLANKLNVNIIESSIIFQFENLYKKYLKSITIDASGAVFPVELEINNIYRSSNPFVFGCKIMNGIIKLGTPIVLKKYDNDSNPDPIYLGKITSLEKNHISITKANIGDKIGIKIENDENTNIKIGNNFQGHILISLVTRESIDALKLHFGDEIRNNRNAVNLIRKNLKPYFQIS